MSNFRLLIGSILAGIAISIGGMVYMSVDNKVVGSLLFSIGLLSIIEYKLPLYTGMVKYLDNIKQLPYYIVMILGNFIGANFVLLYNNFDATSVMLDKMSSPLIITFVEAIACGILMTLATNTSKSLITVLCVMAFILCGFEHSIANMVFAASSHMYNIQTLIFILVCIVGNGFGAVLWTQLEDWGDRH